MADEQTARAAIEASGLRFAVTRHGPVGSLAEAAAARDIEPGDIVKTMVVRRADDDYVFVLVPGDRSISWPKLRQHLGVNRLSMPDADTARAVTGYVRGTITPFGSDRSLPVVADQRIAAHPGEDHRNEAQPGDGQPVGAGRAVSIGGGAFGVAFTVDGAELVAALNAEAADITDPA